MSRAIELERTDLLRDRLRSWSGRLIPDEMSKSIIEGLPEGGRRFRFLIRVVISAICILSGLLLFGLFHVLELPHPEGFAGLVCIAGAVYCMRALGWRHTGAEEGWMVVGASMIIFIPFDGPPTDGVWLLISLAITVAAMVVRAPLFHGIGVLFLFGWIDSISSPEVIFLVAIGAAVILAIVRGLRFDSPYLEISLVWSQFGCALAAAVSLRDEPVMIAGIAAGLIALIVIALRTRDAITFWSIVPLAVAGGYEIGKLIPFPREWKLMLTGAAVIGAAILLEKWLRTPRRGWTSRSFGADDLELPEILGTVSITPSHTLEGPGDDGGRFGGGGATEEF